MKLKTAITLALLVMICLPSGAFSGSDKEKDQLKQSVDDLKAEITILERQIRDMQQGMDRNSGTTSTLITQMSDNVSAIRQGQGRVNEAAIDAINQVKGIGDRLGNTNEKVSALSNQIAELKRLIESLPKRPAFAQITPGNPDQLFGASVADYYQGNYDLAISEFEQFLAQFSSTDIANRAQFFVGECYFAKKKYEQAIAEYEKVWKTYPKGDKVPTAHFKYALALKELGRMDDAQKELMNIRLKFKGTSEAELAARELEH
jgi:tol-pal system protein YbgF